MSNYDHAKLIHGSYEHIGFKYSIYEDERGLRAVPHKGQHSAAQKERHCRAAEMCFNEEYQWDKRK